MADKSVRDEADGPDLAAPHATRLRRRSRRRPRRGGWLRETVFVVISALVLSILIKTFLMQAYFIPSGSMQDTLDVG
ncbi:MAG TPA: hypothetical protein VK024_07725, partial [Actinomycetaceae bacterium]|nr:hypothetical protein [Actinomycetaceae bacterium]